MSNTSIEWTQTTWNPVTGCTKVSPGCANCYAERMARRLKGMGHPNYANGFRVTLHEHILEAPLHWKRPQLVFVNSMGDIFHEDVPPDFILRAFGVMGRASQHVFQILTKRSKRLMQLSRNLPWPDNVWMGVSIENEEFVFRANHLKRTGARVKFISAEPLLGPMRTIDLAGIDWLIVGGESGPGARPMRPEWVLDLRDQCLASGVPFFFKQWGGRSRRKAGRELEGRTWDEMPAMRSALA